jgi:hypothetical protein
MNLMPLADAKRKFAVNRYDEKEGIIQPLYDYQAYAVAGQTQLIFFQVPAGQGGKTMADTNMTNAGQLPAPKSFLIQGIEIKFWSGVTPGTFGAQAAADYVNDVNAVLKSGHFQLFIGSKPYLDEAPLDVFPPSTRMCVDGALADGTTLAADSQSMIQYASGCGRTYTMSPLFLPSNQNFQVTLNWPTAVPLPSDNLPGRIGVRLLGTLYRDSQ